MWFEIESIRRRTPNLLVEVSLRVSLILIVCIMQVHVKPHIHHITELELMKYTRPRKDSYVPPWAMVVIVVFVPLILLCLSYVFTKKYEDTVQSLLAWTLALSINAFITESAKLIIGRPRPDFFYRCFPNGKRTPGLMCNGNLRDVWEGRKSFPSGHSSFAFCSMGFLSVWMSGRLQILSHRSGDGFRVVVCVLPLILASVVAISRCCDNHHHWEDVLVGSLLGFASSYFCYLQYYNPLDSALSGYSYLVTDDEMFDDSCNEFYVAYAESISLESIKGDKKCN